MSNLSEGDVVSISVKVTDKVGKALEGNGTVIMVAGGQIMVLLASGEIWVGSIGCVYPAQSP